MTLLILAISCHEPKIKQRITLAEEFDTEFKIDTTIKFGTGWNAAQGYRFSYPLSFVELHDTIGQVDSSILYSKDQLSKINFFVEGNISRNKDGNDDGEKNSFMEYFQMLTERRHILTQNSKIIRSLSRFNTYDYAGPATFILLGERESTEFVLQTELSEVPIDGTLTFKNFLMEYPKNKKEFYRPIALEIGRTFGQ